MTGNFIPPFEEENLHNETLARLLENEGHYCRKINIQNSLEIDLANKFTDLIFTKNYPDFVIKFSSSALHCDAIHFLTKGYTRPGLMKLMTSVFVGKLLRKRVFITLHPEMFSVMGRLRSKAGGQQLLHMSFAMADKIICGDDHTREVASLHYRADEKFITVPPFFSVPDESDSIYDIFGPLRDCEKTVMIAGADSSDFLKKISAYLIKILPERKTGFILARSSEQRERSGETEGTSGNIVIVSQDDPVAMAASMARADILVRSLSCDCNPLFGDIAVAVKKPRKTARYLYFPESFLIIKEGDVSKDTALMIEEVISKIPHEHSAYDYDPWLTIKNLYR
jgi:hypothetical protein